MKTIELTAIDLDLERAQQYPNAPVDTGEQQLNDLEQPITEAAAPAAEPKSILFLVTINTADVREFYPRKNGRTGTRIVYMNGAARPVQEPYAEVVAKFASLNN
jgi:hypothetical protein